MFLIVSYDISDNKNRTKLAEVLKDYGTRVQFSVFECVISSEQFRELKEKADCYVTGDEDSIRYYQICNMDKFKLKITGQIKKVVHDNTYVA